MTSEDVKVLFDAAKEYDISEIILDNNGWKKAPILPYGYRMTPDGVEYLKSTKARKTLEGEEDDSEADYEEWGWICSPLVVTTHTCDENNCNYGRILEFINTNGFKNEYVMPMELLSGSGEELRKELLSRGVIISSKSPERHRLNAYISSSNPVERAICVDKVGWFRKQYVLPDKVYGQQNGERVVFQSKGTAPKIICSGSFSEWQEYIGKYISGNPILCLSTCVALAAPLLHFLAEENFAIHLSGSSSIGKTTAAHVARSICGNEIHSWRTTDNAAESLARNANDSLLIFDELGEVDGKAADNMAYMLGNGSGKARANKSGDARPITKFRAIILSTGEVGLESKLAEIGKSQRAGQSVRFIEIQADADSGHGIYKELHGFEKGEHLSNHLKQASELYSGTVMDAWFTYLTQNKERQEHVVSLVKALRDEWVHKFVSTNANEQVKRCGRKFALLASVGELATHMNFLQRHPNEQGSDAPILGILSKSINELFQSWVGNRGGEDSHELTEIINCLISFINEHGSSRFAMPWGGTDHDSEHVDMSTLYTSSDQKTYNRAGHRKLVDQGWHYYFFPNVFYTEILKGKNKKVFLKILTEKGIVIGDVEGKSSKSISIPGDKSQRLICISPHVANMGDGNE